VTVESIFLTGESSPNAVDELAGHLATDLDASRASRLLERSLAQSERFPSTWHAICIGG
jgi:hypothetical protein